MRSLALTAIAAALAFSTSPVSAGQERYKRDGYRHSDRVKVERHARHQRRVINSAEEDRANSCDPAGRYSGYPAWARSAFSCGDRGR